MASCLVRDGRGDETGVKSTRPRRGGARPWSNAGSGAGREDPAFSAKRTGSATETRRPRYGAAALAWLTRGKVDSGGTTAATAPSPPIRCQAVPTGRPLETGPVEGRPFPSPPCRALHAWRPVLRLIRGNLRWPPLPLDPVGSAPRTCQDAPGSTNGPGDPQGRAADRCPGGEGLRARPRRPTPRRRSARQGCSARSSTPPARRRTQRHHGS